MIAKTHIAFASLLMVGCSVGILGRMPHIYEVAIAGAAGLLPDLDHPKSTLGRIVPYISIPLAKLFGHRGITHSLLMVGLVIWFLLTHPGEREWPVLPLVIGYLSHILGDLLTPSGVPLLWPVRKKFSLNLFKANGPMENLIFLACWAGVLYFIWVAMHRPGETWLRPLRESLWQWGQAQVIYSSGRLAEWVVTLVRALA
ncbi:metal-dependent hydrolase [Chitinibacter sp. ZOR0017]|uniref:metal-dependent hydrolase n=1 Tax=Chitinibacter sp. ZOR0017 TaxID=1339254 RepID=UPI000690EDAA|nr:metal-dependent hydrolase [Chitinibacter sp. ZOR0017]